MALRPQRQSPRAAAVGAARVRQQDLLSSSLALKSAESGITVAYLGLDQVDNTSDADKPISDATQSALDIIADALAAFIAALKFKQTFGNTTDVSYVITHNKGTTDVIVQVQNLTGSVAVPDAVITDENTLTVSFDIAPGLNAFRAVII